jgi:hypothetical protein
MKTPLNSRSRQCFTIRALYWPSSRLRLIPAGKCAGCFACGAAERGRMASPNDGG